ncbi:MAG: hypothetical protein FWC78_03065 [Defluviitaleaceae bacterium]|nr:hypothetical protein [Defluviitaleaceae bacterium]
MSDAMAEYAPGRVIFVNACFGNSEEKTNVKLTLEDKGIAMKVLQKVNMPSLTKMEREAKGRAEYRRELENTVDSIIAAGERAGKTYTKYDIMKLLGFHDERGISDYGLGAEFDRIQKLEDDETKGGE